jgi:hypothetical protein
MGTDVKNPFPFIIQGDSVPLTPAKGRYTPFGIPIQIHQNPPNGDFDEFGQQIKDERSFQHGINRIIPFMIKTQSNEHSFLNLRFSLYYVFSIYISPLVLKLC